MKTQRHSWKLPIVAAGISLLLVTHADVTLADEPLILIVVFSTDDGKTWAEEPPTLGREGKLKIKVAWSFADPDDAESGMRTARVVCVDGDFRSANNGYHGSWKPKGWYQKSESVYSGTDSVIFDLDLGARPAGVLGDDNSWSGGQFVDGMLPPCDALPPGPHSLLAKLNYVDRGRDQRLEATRDFTLRIADAQGNVPDQLPKPEPRPRATQRIKRPPTSPVPAPPLSTAGPTLYVSTNHPQSDDASDGTSADKPLKTVGRALELVEHGGTIRIAAGTYREGDLVLRKSGTENFPLTIQGEGMDKTFIKGSKQIEDWMPVQGVFGLYRVENHVDNTQQMWADGKALRQIGIKSTWNTKVLWGNEVCLPPVGKDRGDIVPGSFYLDAMNGALYCMLPDHADPSDHLIEAGHAADGLSGAGTSHVVLRDLSIMQNNGTGNAFKSKLLVIGDAHWTVESCRIADGEFTGISWNGRHHSLLNSQIVRNGNTGIDMANTDAAHGWKWYETAPQQHALIEGCLFEGNNARAFYSDLHAGAMKCIPGCRKVKIRDSTFRDNDAPAIWFDHAHGQIVITDNVFDNNKKGIFYEISEPGPGDTFGAFIANNRVANSVQQGIILSASCRSFVVNNTLSNNWVNVALHGMPRKQWTLRDNIVCDNIIGSATKAQLIAFVGTDAENNAIHDNIYVPDDNGEVQIGAVTGTGYDVNIRTMEALHQAGFGANSMIADPMWMAPQENDFALQSGSPAAGKGWRAEGTSHAPPPPMANDPTQTQEADAAHGTLVNGQFNEKASVGGAIGWTPESHGIWKEEDGVRYIHLLTGKHINQQPTVDPAWRQVQLKTRIRIPEIHPGATERDAAGFRLRFEDAQGKVFQPTPHWMFRETTDGWQDVTKILEVPPAAIRLKMTVAIYCEGQMDVDYIRLEAVEEGGDSNE